MAMSKAENLPEEIIVDILTRLPAKSVGQFRCVSKRWCSLLSDPHFIKAHLNFYAHKNEKKLIFTSLSNSIHTITFNHNHQNGKIDAISRKLNFQQPPKDNWVSVAGSCNGLVLVVNDDNIIFLINPTTLKYHRIPTFHLALPMPNSVIMYGLGYDSAGDDYKVVTLSRYYEDRWDFPTTFVDVYSGKTGLWRRIQSSAHFQISLWFVSGVLVNGALHWMAHKGPHTCIIVAFYLSDEKFSEVPTPTELGERDLFGYTIVALRGCLCVFSSRGDVWMMREYGVKESWTRFSITGPPYIEFRLSPLCFVSDDNVVFDVDGVELIVYNRKEDQWRDMMVDGLTATFDRTKSFMESLVSPTFGGIFIA